MKIFLKLLKGIAIAILIFSVMTTASAIQEVGTIRELQAKVSALEQRVISLQTGKDYIHSPPKDLLYEGFIPGDTYGSTGVISPEGYAKTPVKK